jgi:hypothetical protein
MDEREREREGVRERERERERESTPQAWHHQTGLPMKKKTRGTTRTSIFVCLEPKSTFLNYFN